MALRIALTLYLLLQSACAFPELSPADTSDAVAAFRVLGNQTDGFVGFEFAQQSLFGRETCKQGYNQCGFIGECCIVDGGDNCCGTSCKTAQPAGTECCSGYMCPPDWTCCGTSGKRCSPTKGVCCSADGRYCPENWSCCGDQGGCYPHKDFHCCSKDGKFCPNDFTCVSCKGNSSEVCCQGPKGREIPVFETKVPDGTNATALPIPSVSGQAAGNSSATSATSASTGSSSSPSITGENTSSATSAAAQQSSTSTTTTKSGSGANSLRIDWMFGLLLGVLVGTVIF